MKRYLSSSSLFLFLTLTLHTLGITAEVLAQEAAEEPILGAPAALDQATFEEERIPVSQDRRLYREPDLGSPVVGVVAATTELPVVSRRGAWIEVRYGATRGWLLAAPEAGEGDPSLFAPKAVAADPERLARARQILGLSPGALRTAGSEGERGGTEESTERSTEGTRLGPYLLLTDVEDGKLLRELGRVAVGVEEAWQQRTGLRPLASAGEAVVLFARREDYERYSRSEGRIADLGSWGHSGSGIVALSTGGRDPEETRQLLIHELVHLIQRRALGADTPAWVEEGLAEDLAMSRVSGDGHLELGTLWGRRLRTTERPAASPTESAVQRTTLSGPRASPRRLVESWGNPERPPLATLVDLLPEELAAPEHRNLLYPLSAFFVRYLLDGEGSAPAFRSWLATLAQGDPGNGEALREALGASWKELEEGLYSWLRAQE